MRISINQFLLGPCSIFPFFFLFLQILEMGPKHLVHLDHTRGEQQGGDKNDRGDLQYNLIGVTENCPPHWQIKN